MSDPVRYERIGAAAVLTIDRQERRNAVDGPTAEHLRDSYQQLGVPAPFIARVLQTPPNLIWFPSRNELLGARLVTGVWTAAAQRSQGE